MKKLLLIPLVLAIPRTISLGLTLMKLGKNICEEFIILMDYC